MTDSNHATVSRNDAAARYDLTVGGVVAGFTSFHESETHIALTHTEVDDEYQGQGLASQLAAEVVADAVSRGRVIIPVCPYIARYLERHPVEGARIEWPKRAPRA